MHLDTLPYFHATALRQRFVDHLEQATTVPADEQRWLKTGMLERRDAQPGAADELRIDRLSAVTRSGEVIELTASLLLSRTAHTAVFLYQPLLGLQRFDNRALLERYLVAQLRVARHGPLLHYASSAERRRATHTAIEHIQVELLDGPVFEYLMLAINTRLSLALGELDTLVVQQPAADTLWEEALASAPATSTATHRYLSAARYCSQRLRAYWNSKGADALTPAQHLADLLRERLREAMLRQAWATPSAAPDVALLLAWLDDEQGSALQAWTLSVNAAQGDSQVLEGLLVIASDDVDGPLFSYSAARGLERHASRLALLYALAEPSQREDWVPLVSHSRQALLGSMSINALHLEPLSAPACDSWTRQLLDAQAREIETQTRQPGTRDAYLACRRALDIGDQLAHELGGLDTWLTPAEANSPANLAQREAAVNAGSASLDDLGTYLDALQVRIEALQNDVPNLETVTEARLQQVFAAALGDTLNVNQVRLRQGQAVLPLAGLVWHQLSGTRIALDASWQVLGPVVAEQPTRLASLDVALISQGISQVATTLREALASALRQHLRQHRAYRQHLWQLLLAIETRLLEHDRPGAHPAPEQQAPDEEQTVSTTLRAFDAMAQRGLPAASLPDLLRNTLEVPDLLSRVRRLERLATALRVKAQLPAWLRDAAPADQYRYLQVLARNLLQSPSQADYLFDIPSIPDYAKPRVQARLDQDFAPGRYPADTLLITTTRYITAVPPTGEVPSGDAAASVRHQQTLVDYALNHYRDWDHAITAIALKDDLSVPARIDAPYLHALVRELDLGAGYLQLLKERLDPAHPDHPRRLALFCRQLPGQLLETAWRAQLKGELSAAAVACVSAVLDQPDATARDLQPGPAVQLLPLELIADTGMRPDTVPGIYLFMHQEPSQGTVVMYTPYAAGTTLRAFDSSADLLHQLRTDATLQAQVLERLPDTLRPRYAHGGFVEAHLPYGAEFDFELPLYPQQPVTLAHRPVLGNALLYLFDANVALLQDMARAQLVTGAQARWDTLKDVLGLLWNQLTMFIPGRIGLLLAAWQSELTVLQILDRATEGSWSSELSALTCVLVQSLLVGHGVREQAAQGIPVSEADFWQRMGQAPRQQLARYEVPHQALDGLSVHEQVYASADGSAHFVPLDGKVYRTRQLDGRWHLSAAEADEPGPALRRNHDGRWQLDPQQALAVLSGGAVGKLGGWAIRQALNSDQIVIRAVGMRQIRQRMPVRADMLRRAHRTALGYLGTCLDNLHQARPASRMAVQTRDILSDFFGIPAPDDALVQRVREPVEKILNMMVSRDYSAASSERYVLASSVGNYSGLAFTSPHDPLRQLFMMDAYFEHSYVDRFVFRPEVSWQDADAIGRANCLIHEFSHLAYGTRDIRYIEAAAPFIEMLMPGQQRDWLKRQHDETFSHRTLSRNLFAVRTREGTRRDITRDDNKGLSIILTAAGARDLATARDRFLNDAEVRSKILLKNADSLTLLVYRLGQASHTAD